MGLRRSPPIFPYISPGIPHHVQQPIQLLRLFQAGSNYLNNWAVLMEAQKPRPLSPLPPSDKGVKVDGGGGGFRDLIKNWKGGGREGGGF